MSRRAMVWAVLLLVSGCGEPSEGPSGDDVTTGDEHATVGASEDGKKPSAIEVLGITPPDEPWAEMTFDEREFYMIGKVLPISAEQFREFDATAFPELECESCHGENAEERKFAMPAKDLPPIPKEGTPEFAEVEKNQPRMVRFMSQTVTPTTRTLLGLPEAEFGCNGCHPTP